MHPRRRQQRRPRWRWTILRCPRHTLFNVETLSSRPKQWILFFLLLLLLIVAQQRPLRHYATTLCASLFLIYLYIICSMATTHVAIFVIISHKQHAIYIQGFIRHTLMWCCLASFSVFRFFNDLAWPGTVSVFGCSCCCFMSVRKMKKIEEKKMLVWRIMKIVSNKNCISNDTHTHTHTCIAARFRLLSL